MTAQGKRSVQIALGGVAAAIAACPPDDQDALPYLLRMERALGQALGMPAAPRSPTPRGRQVVGLAVLDGGRA